ncbi:hypothetical protein FACS189426_18970 [Bacteroidia bacterium]|nr:hypothetical protein FACS189426_18970 [Bacteroidia bacterium]GHV70953.1 hypothetical protein FACS189420_4160 [Bacteroidia bacterium]
MMRKLFFLFTILCWGSANVFSQNITFKATSEKAVVVNQQFRVTYTLTTNGETGKDFRFQESKDFEVLFDTGKEMGTSAFMDGSGKVVSRHTESFKFVFLAKKEGTFTIPPSTIKVGNSEYKSNELTIKVLPPDQTPPASSGQGNSGQSANSSGSGTSSSDDVFIRMHVSKNSVYENEGLLVTFKLYTLINVEFANQPKFPEFEGFSAYEIEQSGNQASLENYNGRNYQTVIIKQTILYPIHSGKITIGAGKFDVIAQVRSQQRQRSIFDDFLTIMTPVKKSLTTSPVTIDVKPLPPGKPASFSGAVGDYKMTSSISTNKLKSNDAVTVKATISGNGNIKLITNPEIVFPNDFDVLDPVINTNSKISQGGVNGTKTIEYNAIPRFAGDFTIPKAEFSFFDLKSGTYKTLTTEEFQLHVEQDASGNGGTAPIINSSNKQDVRFLGKDILFIKTEGYHFHKGTFFYGTINYALFYIIPALLFIILFIIYRKQAAENANIALVRTKKANKVASKRLKMAAKYLKENKKEAFYDEILKAVWGYLSDKLNIPVSALTKDNVDANLTQYGAGENLIGDFRNILDTAEFARFAPAQGSGEMDELYNSTVQAIDKMESTIKK